MTPITPATPASESSGIVPQLQYVENAVWVNSTWCFWHLSAQLSMAEVLLSFCAWKYYFCKHCYEVLKTKWHGKVSPSSTLPFLPFPLCPSFFPTKIRNIVSTVNLGCKLDLKTIALRARNAEYNPKVRPHSISEKRVEFFFDVNYFLISHSDLLPSSWEYENRGPLLSSSVLGRWCARELKGQRSFRCL